MAGTSSKLFHVLLQDALADEEVALRVATVLFDKVMIKLCHGIPRRLLLPLPLPAAGNLNPCETFLEKFCNAVSASNNLKRKPKRLNNSAIFSV